MHFAVYCISDTSLDRNVFDVFVDRKWCSIYVLLTCFLQLRVKGLRKSSYRFYKK